MMSRNNLVAFVPLDIATADKMRWKMPAEALLRALRERTGGRVAISDRNESVPESCVEAGVTETEHYIDWIFR